MAPGRTRTDASIDGVLPVDKPAGPTSHGIVARVRRALGTRRIGHTGTLDSFASGLMLLCIGRATRIVEYLTGMDKRYTAVVRLGTRTDTHDATGTVLSETDASDVTLAQVESALEPLRGEIDQVPPVFSAKKVAGERAYALAREGAPPELPPARVRIDELRVTRFEPPELELEIACSSGTYIRAIARDIGEALGVGAHLTQLRRTSVGPHTIDRALTLDAIESDPKTAIAALIPPLAALGDMPRVDITDDEIAHVTHGRPIANEHGHTGLVALALDGSLVSIGEAVGPEIHPRKVFV